MTKNQLTDAQARRIAEAAIAHDVYVRKLAALDPSARQAKRDAQRDVDAAAIALADAIAKGAQQS